ncbi:hypothetical protein SK128_017317 [Halocaridina rubra]|uniref:Homologous recombination OB-fold protein OB-fold domain-containing protein n=1 Tax=Halocaridina rubra TaxID=373956 RepID=A0AAN8WPF2_HALRR
MFEGDNDDFSFIDDDFLDEVLQQDAKENSVSKVPQSTEPKACLNENNCDTGVRYSENCLKDASEEQGSSGINFKEQSVSLETESIIRHENHRPLVGKNREWCRKDAVSNSFAVDDFFDNTRDTSDFFDIENTPQDKEVISGSLFINQSNSDPHEKHGNSPPSEKHNIHEKTDFRSRILQTLLENRQSGIQKKKENYPHSIPRGECSLNSNSGISKKRGSDEEDTFVSKKLNVLSSNENSRSEDCSSNSYCQSSCTPLKAQTTSVRRKSVSPGGPVIQKRKFPGPAGILPNISSNTDAHNIQQYHENEQCSSDSKAIICSQSSADDFTRGPWQQMVNDLEDKQSCKVSPLSILNIKWILKRAAFRGVAGVRKIPLLAVMIRNIDTTFIDATVILKDKTGEMNGTVASVVFEEYGSYLQSGSVLLLKDVTLLSPISPTATSGGRELSRKHYLNITQNSILSIYSLDDSGDVLTTTVSKVDIKELINKVTSLKEIATLRPVVEEEEEEIYSEKHMLQQSLFSNLVESYGMTAVYQNKKIPSGGYNAAFSSFSPRVNIPSQQQQCFRPLSFNNISSRMGNTSGPFLPRGGSSSSSFFPRVSSPNVNGIPRPQRFLPPPRQQHPYSNSVSQNSFNSTFKQLPIPSISSNSVFPSSPKTSSKLICSQQEEKEVNDLLDSIDVDSLFGDF